MSRRAFLSLTLGALTNVALAQSEGRQFVRLNNQQTSAPRREIEVIEFFAYSCPHCYRLEPALQDWVKANTDRIRFRRIHMETRAFELHQRLFYALQSKHVSQGAHRMAFQAFHEDGNLLRSERGILPLWMKLGFDATELGARLNSRDVDRDIEIDRQTQLRFGVTRWPTVVVGGRFFTNPELAATDVSGVSEDQAIGLTIIALTKMLATAENERN